LNNPLRKSEAEKQNDREGHMSELEDREQLMQRVAKALAAREYEYAVCSLCGSTGSPYGEPKMVTHNDKLHGGEAEWVRMKILESVAKRLRV
jgi:hypothetical protein